MSNGDEASSIFFGIESESMRLMFILSDRGLHESVFFVIVRSDTLHGPTSRLMAGHPIARPVRLTGPVTRRSVESVLRWSSRRRARRRQ